MRLQTVFCALAQLLLIRSTLDTAGGQLIEVLGTLNVSKISRHGRVNQIAYNTDQKNIHTYCICM